MSSDTQQRLNKTLALELGISRREADDLIAAKRVRINDITAILGARINPKDTITVDERKIVRNKPLTYIMLHKPSGYVCSRKQQGEIETIYSLLPTELHDLKPVGRLDKDSSGLILLTNDGDFAYQMTHPKFHKTKEYEATLDKDLEPLHQQMISDHGVQLEDGPSKLMLERISETNRTDWKVLMHEGRNRQIRRTFSALGYTVVALHRTHFGMYNLDQLVSGEFISVTV